MKLTRSKFEQLTEDLVGRVRTPVEKALSDAGIDIKKIDEVILVGGSTRMPMIQQLVQDMTGKAPNKSVNPDEVVSLGAAIQAGVLAGDVKDVLLLDVTPLSLGLETMGAVMTTLIPRNTTIPTRKTEIFSTAEDSQTAVDIHFLQGERPMSSDNKTLGRFRLDGIPPARACHRSRSPSTSTPTVSQRDRPDKATGSSNPDHGVHQPHRREVERMVQQARTREAADRKRRELSEARNTADQLIYTVEKTMRELGDKLQANDRQQVKLINRSRGDGEDTTRIATCRNNCSRRPMPSPSSFTRRSRELGQRPRPDRAPTAVTKTSSRVSSRNCNPAGADTRSGWARGLGAH